MSKEPLHPMGVVTRRTGLRSEVIRAWERRYGAIEPTRTPGNHRLYSDADIERLLLIRRALDVGFQIGHVASLPDAQIEALVADSSVSRFEPRTRSQDKRPDAERFVERCLERVFDLDDAGLKRQLEAASVELSRIQLLDELLVPLMIEVGDACADGRLRMANEHLASTVARSFLDSLRAAFPASERDPGLVITTPIYQNHELAAMIVAATARSEGWRTTYLGPNLPAEEIASSAKKLGARAVALSITWPDNDENLKADLIKLGRLLPDEIALIAGGRSAASYRAELDRVGARQPEDLKAFRRMLQELASAERAS